MWFVDSTGKLRRALVDDSGHIQVNAQSYRIWERYFTAGISESFHGLYVFGVESASPNTQEIGRSALKADVETVAGSTVLNYKGTGVWREIALASVQPYPIAEFYMILPTMATGVIWFFGIETSPVNPWPMYANIILHAAGLRGEVLDRGSYNSVDLTASLPADYNTALNTYRIVLSPSKVEYYVNNTLAGHIDLVEPYASTEACAFVVQQSPVGMDGYISYFQISRWDATIRPLVDSLGHPQVDVLTSPLSALIGEVQASPTTYTVLDRLKTLATLLNAGLPAALDTGALKVREQSPLTEVDVDIAKILGTAVSLTNYLPAGVVYPAGTLIDPRDVSDRAARLLGIIYGDKGQLAQRTTTKEALTDLIRIGGTAQTARDVAADYATLVKLHPIGRVLDRTVNTSLTAGVNAIKLTTVPSGQLWKITRVAWMYEGTITNVDVTLEQAYDVDYYFWNRFDNPVSGFIYDVPCELWLTAGDHILAVVYNCTLNDIFRLYGFGVKYTA